MIIFETVRAKNFLSIGNEFIEIKLNSVNKTLVVGENGSGKSANILESITYALYGKPYRKINKPQLINSIIKKHMLVELEFKIDSSSYLIRRGMKPNIFEIFQNGILLNQPGDSKDYQSILETQILRKTYKSFLQIDILGSAKYTAFMELSSGDRRAVIEDLLDLQIFSNMNIICKQKIQDNLDEIKQIEYELNNFNEKLRLFKESQKQTIEFYDKEIQNKQYELNLIDEKCKLTQKKIKEKEIECNKLKHVDTEINELKLKDIELHRRVSILETKIQNLQEQISFLNHSNNCPTCKQVIDIEYKHKTIDDYTKEIDVYTSQLNKFNTASITLSDKIKRITSLKLSYNGLKSDLDILKNSNIIYKNQYESLTKEIERLTKQRNETNIQKCSDENLITIDIQNSNKTLETLKIRKNQLQTILISLKDTGVKARIISEYIPLLNQRINHYLDKLNFHISFELSENFEEIVKSRYRDIFSYNSFSEGQKGRLNLAILFAFRDIATARNSVSSNLLIMDEILDSSLDDNGTDDFMNLLDSMIKTNIFIISHRTDNISDKFDRILQFSLKKNFTQIDEY